MFPVTLPCKKKNKSLTQFILFWKIFSLNIKENNNTNNLNIVIKQRYLGWDYIAISNNQNLYLQYIHYTRSKLNPSNPIITNIDIIKAAKIIEMCTIWHTYTYSFERFHLHFTSIGDGMKDCVGYTVSNAAFNVMFAYMLWMWCVHKLYKHSHFIVE